MKSYSSFFETLHDERKPTGSLGRGTHYSVLRAVVWHDPTRSPLMQGFWFDFGVVWDEDHDERVIDAVMGLYLEGLLSPVVFVGERKGTLSIVLRDETIQAMGRVGFGRYERAVNEVCGRLDDPWPSSIGAMSNCGTSIIDADDARVELYLSSIDMLWTLGLKPAVWSSTE